MTLRLRLGLFAALCLSLFFMTRALSQPPEPISVSYELGAYAGAPVIYTLRINGNVLLSPNDVLSGAARVPPTDGGGTILNIGAYPPPDNTKLDIKLEWTEIWTGRQFVTQTRIDKSDFPWFSDRSIRLLMTFEPNGGFVIRIPSEKLTEEARARISSGPVTLADYPVVFETCAEPLDGPTLNYVEVREIIDSVWAVDMEWIEENRNTPVPAPRCPDPAR